MANWLTVNIYNTVMQKRLLPGWFLVPFIKGRKTQLPFDCLTLMHESCFFYIFIYQNHKAMISRKNKNKSKSKHI